MSEPRELPAVLHERIKALCSAGDDLAENGKYEDAVGRYNEALRLVPDPKTDWSASTWILAAIGDACFLGGFRASAVDALRYAMHCPNAIGNPFLHLRLGQVLFDQGDRDQAADELARAYMGAGEEIFAAEDPRYRSFLATRMKL